jgi:murein DD-endopeptidase MepM/ murein hydrolase activator NlpD
MRGYGNTVTIDHGGGMSTLYAHCSSITVSPGQIVNMGQTIATVGSTGYSTGPHLHFEIIRNKQHQNPRNYVAF